MRRDDLLPLPEDREREMTLPMDNANRQSESCFPASIAVLVAFATLQAIEVNFGHLHPIGLAWIIVAMVLLVGGLRRKPRGGLRG